MLAGAKKLQSPSASLQKAQESEDSSEDSSDESGSEDNTPFTQVIGGTSGMRGGRLLSAQLLFMLSKLGIIPLTSLKYKTYELPGAMHTYHFSF